VTVKAKPNGVSLGELAQKVNLVVNDVKVPQEVLIQVGGAYEDQQESFMDLALLMLLSLILVFIVMASQFESFTMPFIIMFSIPFAFTGVILALLITGTTLSVVAALGAVLLIGIVVKNGIVLVDFTNLMRDRGMKLYEAIVVSGRSRPSPCFNDSAYNHSGNAPFSAQHRRRLRNMAPDGDHSHWWFDIFNPCYNDSYPCNVWNSCQKW
jgi:hydrophobic/amphiphilic exporter-1 (mainly G- bacteria), HAE1 family